MRLLYSLFGYVAQLVCALLSIFNPKVRQIVQGRRQTAERLRQSLQPDRYTIWFHAASLGEFEQGRPLMERIRSDYPEAQIVLSFFSPSGYNVCHNYDGADVVVYLPVDTGKSVREFLDNAHPDIAVFIKYDFWPTMLDELQSRDIPTYLVSAIFRKEQLFFRSYGAWYRTLLTRFTHIFVQDQNSQDLLGQIGIKGVTIAGDTRFDRVVKIALTSKDIPEVACMQEGGKTLLVAGSSWLEDEDLLIPYFNTHHNLKMVLAPHEIDEGHISQITSLLQRPWALYTNVVSGQHQGEYDCIIMNCFGLLSSVYRYGSIAYVGGGFGKGIHNTVEPAVYGLPVLFGPNNQKFREAQELKNCGGGLEIDSRESGVQILDRLLSDESYRKRSGEASWAYVQQKVGATDSIIQYLLKDLIFAKDNN